MQLPPQVLLALSASQSQVELAMARHAQRMAEVERDFGFRFSQSRVGPNGTVVPIARPRAVPPEGVTQRNQPPRPGVERPEQAVPPTAPPRPPKPPKTPKP